MSLFGIIIMSVVNFFIAARRSCMSSGLVSVLFFRMTAYDIQASKVTSQRVLAEMYEKVATSRPEAVSGPHHLFLSLLRILAGEDNLRNAGRNPIPPLFVARRPLNEKPQACNDFI